MQEAGAEEEEEGGGRRQRARDVRRDARQAERELQANRMRKKDVRPSPPVLIFSPAAQQILDRAIQAAAYTLCPARLSRTHPPHCCTIVCVSIHHESSHVWRMGMCKERFCRFGLAL